jgi:hypothetical protein
VLSRYGAHKSSSPTAPRSSRVATHLSLRLARPELPEHHLAVALFKERCVPLRVKLWEALPLRHELRRAKLDRMVVF